MSSVKTIERVLGFYRYLFHFVGITSYSELMKLTEMELKVIIENTMMDSAEADALFCLFIDEEDSVILSPISVCELDSSRQFPIKNCRELCRRFGKVCCKPWRYIDEQLEGEDLYKYAHSAVESYNKLGLPGVATCHPEFSFLSELNSDNKAVISVFYEGPVIDGKKESYHFTFIMFSEKGKTYLSDCSPWTDGYYSMNHNSWVRMPFIKQWLECVESCFSTDGLKLQPDLEL